MSRVLVLCEYGSLNGGERSLLAVLPHLAPAGFEVTVACPCRGPLRLALHSSGIPTLELELRDGDNRRLAADEIRQSLHHLLDQSSPDCVHANSLSMTRLLGAVADSCPTPCLGHLRDIIRISRASVVQLNAIHRLLAVSDAVKQWYVAQGVHDWQLQILYNGVDLRRFAPRPKSGYLHRELNLPGSSLLVGAIGQIGIRKGLDVLLAATESVVRKRGEVHLLIVGQRYSQKEEAREYELELHRAAERGGSGQHVHFLGVRNDVWRLLNELDLLVHAARQEPLGRVLLESAASGLPIIATDVGGTREIFPAESDSAVLIPPSSQVALAESMLELLAEATRREAMGRRARQRAEQMFGAEAAASRLAGHYREVLRQPAG